MKLKGILDFSLGNFLCLRGFAPMGILQDISKLDENIQRIPRDERLKEISEYLKKGEFVFFPELILCTSLSAEEGDAESVEVSKLYRNVKGGNPNKILRFANGLNISSVVAHSRKADDIRAVKYFQVGTIQFDTNNRKRHQQAPFSTTKLNSSTLKTCRAQSSAAGQKRV